MSTYERRNQIPEGEHIPNNTDGQAKPTDGLKMDYDETQDGEVVDSNLTHSNAPTVGLIGGQPKDDESGLDVSQYTGPHSKPSSEFHDPEAPYHTGPGNNQGQ